MGLFSKGGGSETIDASWIRAIGMVVTAEAPPLRAPSSGPYAKGSITVLVDAPPTGRRQLSLTARHADTHWVVAGMEVPVALDPARPDVFAIDWAAVPTMPQQVEANHPALADPFAASRRIAATAGITPSEKTAARYERFQAAVAAAAGLAAPPGRIRAVAMTVTIRGRYGSYDGGDDGSSGSGVSFTENSPAVLSVAVAGRPPYPVYLEKFKFPRRRLSLPGEPMPALVSATDPRAVEILWTEMPTLMEQAAARMSDGMRANQQLHAGLAQHYQAAVDQAVAAGPPPPPPGGWSAGGYPPGVPVPGTGIPPQARQLLLENLRRAMLYMPDPAKRQLLIDQYRTMGLEVTREELGL
jgi:hypothetical protein